MNVFSIIVVIVLLLVVLIVGFHYVYNVCRLLFSTTRKAPYIPSFNRQLELMKQLKLKEDSVMVDLGCGDWKALRFFSKEHKIKLLDWYDINVYAIFRWKLLNKHQRITNVNLYRKDLFDVNLKKYDYIYVYLRSTQLAVMEDWIRKEKKKDAIIISNSFTFRNHKPYKVYKNEKWVDTVFLYK